MTEASACALAAKWSNTVGFLTWLRLSTLERPVSEAGSSVRLLKSYVTC